MDAERQVSRCHLGSETALICKWLFGLEILSKFKYEPLKNIRVLSQGTTLLCSPLLHFACPDSFHGWGKLSIFLCSASKSSKEELIPIQSSFIHTHFTSHIFPYPLLPISMLSRKNLLLGDLCLQQIISYCFPEKYILFPATGSCSPQVAGTEQWHKVLVHLRAGRPHPLSSMPENDTSLGLN